MSIPSIVFKKWRGAFDVPSQSKECKKQPSLNRVKNTLRTHPRLRKGKEPLLSTAQNHGNKFFLSQCYLMFVNATSPKVLCMYNFAFKSFPFIIIFFSCRPGSQLIDKAYL